MKRNTIFTIMGIALLISNASINATDYLFRNETNLPDSDLEVTWQNSDNDPSKRVVPFRQTEMDAPVKAYLKISVKNSPQIAPYIRSVEHQGTFNISIKKENDTSLTGTVTAQCTTGLHCDPIPVIAETSITPTISEEVPTTPTGRPGSARAPVSATASTNQEKMMREIALNIQEASTTNLTLDTIQTPQSQKNWHAMLTKLDNAASEYDIYIASPKPTHDQQTIVEIKGQLMQLHTKVTELFTNMVRKISNKTVRLQDRKQLLDLYERMTSDWTQTLGTKLLFNELPQIVAYGTTVNNLKNQLAQQKD